MTEPHEVDQLTGDQQARIQILKQAAKILRGGGWGSAPVDSGQLQLLADYVEYGTWPDPDDHHGNVVVKLPDHIDPGAVARSIEVTLQRAKGMRSQAADDLGPL